MGEQFGGTSHANYARFDAIRVAFRFLFNSRTTLSTAGRAIAMWRRVDTQSRRSFL